MSGEFGHSLLLCQHCISAAMMPSLANSQLWALRHCHVAMPLMGALSDKVTSACLAEVKLSISLKFTVPSAGLPNHFPASSGCCMQDQCRQEFV